MTTLKLTKPNNNPIRSLLHSVLVVSSIQLGESRQTSRSHPVLEVFIVVQVRWRVFCCIFSSRELCYPIWRRNNIVKA